MKYLLSLLSISTLALALNYPSETIISESAEYSLETENYFYEDTELTYIDFQEVSDPIEYLSYSKAQEEAIEQNKFLLIEIESDNCVACDKLNNLLYSNENLKNIISSYTKAVKLNREYDTIPSSLDYIGTPTIFLLDAETGKVLMKLQGNEASEELEASLQSVLW